MQAEARQKLILVVEDEPWTRTTEVALLAGEGYAVVEARDGTEALRLAADLAPDAILLDMALPTISGLDVLRTLKEQAATRQIPVIIVSAYSHLVGLDDAALAASSLPKPFGYDELVGHIEQATVGHLSLA